MRLLPVFALLIAITSCGPTPSEPGEPDATITIGATGVTPKEVRIKAWGHVRFVNSDSRPHAIVSDPVDVHDGCPAINRVGLLQPGESRETGTLHLAGTCGFHDHDNQVEAYRGRILVQ